jgi:hypothetical protein
MNAAHRFCVIYEGGRRGIVEALDSVEALALAQRQGSVWSLWCEPSRASRFWVVM